MPTEGFWGLQLEPGFIHSEKVVKPFVITMATLPETIMDTRRSTLGIKVDNLCYALCSLIPDKVEQQTLNLNFQAGESVAFYIKGDNPIHLTGNYTDSTSDRAVIDWGERNNQLPGDNKTQHLMKRPADVVVYNEPKKRRDDPKSPKAYEKPVISRIHHLLDSMNQSALQLHALKDQGQMQLMSPVSIDRQSYYQQQQQEPELAVKVPRRPPPKVLHQEHEQPLHAPVESKSEHHHQPRQPDCSHKVQRRQSSPQPHIILQKQEPPPAIEARSKEKTVSKRKSRIESRKASEDFELKAKIKQDERMEAKKRQEEKKKEKKMEPRKPEMKKAIPTIISEPISPSPSPPSTRLFFDEEPEIAPQQKLPDGFIVDDKKLGTGPRVSTGDKVGLRFIVKLVKGNVLAKHLTGDLFNFTMGQGQVAAGWELGVKGMKVGGERRVTIDPLLAELQQGIHPGVPPNESITLDIRLEELQMAE